MIGSLMGVFEEIRLANSRLAFFRKSVFFKTQVMFSSEKKICRNLGSVGNYRVSNYFFHPLKNVFSQSCGLVLASHASLTKQN